MNLLDVADRIEAGSYRSDRFPAVPFVTVEGVLDRIFSERSVASPTIKEFNDHIKTSKTYTVCGASLTTGEGTQYCMKRTGHVWTVGDEHDWVASL